MRLFTAAMALLVALGAQAQLNGDGFYYVENVNCNRFVYVMDNRGRIDYNSTSADVSAMHLYKDLGKAVCDPAAVIYFKEISEGWDFQAQGTGTYEIINYPVKLLGLSDGTYRCYASKSGVTMYLADRTTSKTAVRGYMNTVNASYTPVEAKNWYLHPIDAATDYYFGVKPTIAQGDKFYAPFYVSFAFQPASSGMKVYTVKLCDSGMAVWEEFAGDVVPAKTPVIIECSSDNPSDNRLNLFKTSVATVGTNLLKGNFFRNGETYDDDYAHKNVTRYDAATMRVLGVTAEGKLGFVTGSDTYLDANSIYLPVTAGDETEAEYPLVTQDEYDEAIYLAGVHGVSVASARANNVYSVSGQLVRRGTTSLQGLAQGVYIINNKKYIVKP